MGAKPTGWSRVSDLIAILRRRWKSGRYLSDHLAGADWSPVLLPINAPKATELLDRLGEITAWLERFESDSRDTGGRDRFTIEYRTLGGRTVGSNRLPARIRIDTFHDLCALLGTTNDTRSLEGLVAMTRDRLPGLVPWVIAHPLVTLANATVWPDVLATVEWIATHDAPHLYIRQIDVERVDTKFVEANRNLLSDLLAIVLPSHRFDAALPRHDFAGRYRFRRKPSYTRLRLLAPMDSALFAPGITELTLRTDELARQPPPGRAFIIENEVSYLAFPDVPGAIAIFGGGFGIDIVKAIDWLDDVEVIYWGDIDTHGLVMLSRLRARFPHVQSMLMDDATLMAHQAQWVAEPTPTDQPLLHLTGPEADLYRDLIEDRYGTHVRLEQERIRFSLVRSALWPLHGFLKSPTTTRFTIRPSAADSPEP